MCTHVYIIKMIPNFMLKEEIFFLIHMGYTSMQFETWMLHILIFLSMLLLTPIKHTVMPIKIFLLFTNDRQYTIKVVIEARGYLY